MLGGDFDGIPESEPVKFRGAVFVHGQIDLVYRKHHMLARRAQKPRDFLVERRKPRLRIHYEHDDVGGDYRKIRLLVCGVGNNFFGYVGSGEHAARIHEDGAVGERFNHDVSGYPRLVVHD